MKTCIALLTAAIFLAASAPAHANGGKVWDYTLIRKVPELRQACEAASKNRWETGTTAQMIEASYDYKYCLIGIIQQILDAYYPTENKEFVKRVKDIASNIRVLYWDIYCLREELCGSMYNVGSIGDQLAFIEDVLKTMTDHIKLEMR